MLELLIAALLLAPAATAAEDLAKKYKATLDFREPARPVEWTCTPKDVWSLSKFRLERGEKLSVSCGAATAVFGTKDGNAVWAVILPEQAAVISGSASAGEARATSILLRFNPQVVGDLFPAGTVGKAGPEFALLAARRLVAHKLTETGYHYDNFPIVQKRGQLVIDCELEDGARRVFYADSDAAKVELDGRLHASPIPKSVAIERETSLEAFEQAWKEFDAVFPRFAQRPEVDWDALYKRFKPLAAQARSSWETAAAIALLIEPLRDLHAYVKCGDEWMPQYRRFRPQNGVMIAARKLVGELSELADGQVRWARSEDGLGYLQVNGVGSDAIPKAVDQALDALADTWGLVLDLRFNGGGGTDIAANVAGRFVDQERVYANSQYRAGTSKRAQLGPLLPRRFSPRGPWRYQAPVAVLLGRKCMSSGEELALMVIQCPQVVTLGDSTAGSSAAPKSLELPGGIVVNVPRWNDCDAAGKPYEDVGVAPKVAVRADPEEFAADKDPVLTAGLEHLRKTPPAKRKAGKP